jgi:hypothetical protein
MPNVVDLAVGDTKAVFLEQASTSTRTKPKGMGFQVCVRTLESILTDDDDDLGVVMPYTANNRIGGKIIMSMDMAWLFLEDNRKNYKLFPVPDGGRINARKVRNWVPSSCHYLSRSFSNILHVRFLMY